MQDQPNPAPLGVKLIPLWGRTDNGRGRPKRANTAIKAYAIVDAEDYAEQAKFRWHLAKSGGGYARRAGLKAEGRARQGVFLHREVLGMTSGFEPQVDHINRNPLDCRKANLRVVPVLGNRQNVGSWGSTSQHRGVFWHKGNKRWAAIVKLNYKNHWLGYYDTEEEAAEVASAFRAKHMPYSADARAA